MKKLLCISILLIGYSHAQEIPTLAQLKPQFDVMTKGLALKHPDMAKRRNDAAFLSESISNYLESDWPEFNRPPNIIESTLKRWYQEQPGIFNLTLTLELTGDTPLTLLDLFNIKLRIRRDYFSPNQYPYIGRLDELKTIIDILKQLGVKQTLSDKQIDNIAQLAAAKIQEDLITQASGGMETVEEL